MNPRARSACARLFTAAALSVLIAGAQAQPAGGGQRSTMSQYQGGGIRGATEELPDGWLVSPAEAKAFKGEEGYNEAPALRPRAVVPLIDIIKPDAVGEQKVKAPFAIQAQFKGQADAPIDPSTFKVLYGALKIDITSRVSRNAKLNRDGFSFDKAQIPAGKHRIILQVQDSKQRVAERELRVDVE